MPKHHQILNAASNLLGIALIIIAGLHVTNTRPTFADEIAWLAATCFSLSCLFSYLAVRSEPEDSRFVRWADLIFLAGLASLVTSVFVLAAIKL